MVLIAGERSRLLLVGHYLGAGNIPVQAIAHQLDFPSATALRNLLKRYTGLRPRDVRAGGGLMPVLAAFTRALRNQSLPAPSGCS
jgi:AraC-like DNA-binding protein